MKKYLALLLLAVVLPLIGYSQEGEYRIIGSLREMQMPNLRFQDEDLGTVNGCVKSENGKVISNATIVLNNGWYFFDASSNKKGEYKARVLTGNYTIEVSAPGFEKYVEEIYASNKRPLNKNIVLKPIVKGAEKMMASGNKSLASGNSILFNINGKHPAYEGKSFYDVLVNLPLFDFSDGGLKVAGSDNVTMHFNSRMNKAQPQMLANMLRSIAAEDVQSVKVSSWGGQGESPMMVYLNYKE